MLRVAHNYYDLGSCKGAGYSYLACVDTELDHFYYSSLFLQVLMHIVTICQAEAAVLLAATQAAADQIKDAVKAAGPQFPEDDPDEMSGLSGVDAVRAYFEEHNKAKAGAAAEADVNYTARELFARSWRWIRISRSALSNLG